jgi:acetylornithine deacetylase/succinyl-diaminopimelate desuccinylase-like protein
MHNDPKRPFLAGSAPRRFHGINERITVENYREHIRFYHRLMQHLNQERELAD